MVISSTNLNNGVHTAKSDFPFFAVGYDADKKVIIDSLGKPLLTKAVRDENGSIIAGYLAQSVSSACEGFISDTSDNDIEGAYLALQNEINKRGIKVPEDFTF